MKSDTTEIVFILDRSGSMGGAESDTIGGVNSVIAKQKELPGDAVVSTVLFDDRVEVLHNRIGLREVKPMTQEQYFVRGSTALLDAVGSTIERIVSLHREMGESAPSKTIFIIITDGYENSSRTYRYPEVRRLVECQKESGWEFLFMGADIDAVGEAGKIGINADRAVRFEHDEKGFEDCYCQVCCDICRYRDDLSDQ